MKIKISEVQYQLAEALNLNLGKQLTKYQKKQPVTEKLDAIFGKGVYRLYYDLKSGKQIFPTKNSEKTELKFDLNFTNELKKNITELLRSIHFSVIDFDKNLAKNDNNGQQIKITKILNNRDNAYLKEYALYLDQASKNSITGGIKSNDNMCVVISRHAYDIGGMSTDRAEFSSCEDLGDYTDIKQISNLKSSDETYGDGDGIRLGDMIRGGYFIFYTIKYGDWNIKNPYSRFLQGIYCMQDASVYGRNVDGFKDFFRKWIFEYEKKTNNSSPEDIDNVVQTYDVRSLERYYQNRVYDDTTNEAGFFRLLFKYKRDDFFREIFGLDDVKNNYFSEYDIRRLNVLFDYFGKGFIQYLTPETGKGIIDELTKFVNTISTTQNYYFNRVDYYKKFLEAYQKTGEKTFLHVKPLYVSWDYYTRASQLLNYPNLFYAFLGKNLIDSLVKNHREYFNGKMDKIDKQIDAEYKQYVQDHVHEYEPKQQVAEKIDMNKIKITESQYKTIRQAVRESKDSVNEVIGLSNTNNDKMGAVEINKQLANNPSNIKKYTSQGLDVKIVNEEEPLDEAIFDEALGSEQEAKIKHRFEGKKLNIFSTRDKVTIREVMKYVSELSDQSLVEDSFNNDRVTLHVKEPSSGRYKVLGTFSKDALHRYKDTSNREIETGEQSQELNEEVSDFEV